MLWLCGFLLSWKNQLSVYSREENAAGGVATVYSCNNISENRKLTGVGEVQQRNTDKEYNMLCVNN